MLYKGTYLALGLALVANTTLANIDEIVTVATRAEADVAEVIGTVSVLMCNKHYRALRGLICTAAMVRNICRRCAHQY